MKYFHSILNGLIVFFIPLLMPCKRFVYVSCHLSDEGETQRVTTSLITQVVTDGTPPTPRPKSGV